MPFSFRALMLFTKVFSTPSLFFFLPAFCHDPVSARQLKYYAPISPDSLYGTDSLLLL